MSEHIVDPDRRSAVVGGALAALVAVVALVVFSVSSCDRGVADRVATHRLAEATSGGPATSVVVRREPAPPAQPASAVPDPRCRAARRLFLRAAIDPDPMGAMARPDAERLLDQVDVLVEGPRRADLAAVRALARRSRQARDSIGAAEQQATIDRLERLLVWTVTTCPPPQRPVWGCAAPVTFGRPDLFDGSFLQAAGQLVPDEAVIDRLGEPEGRRIELTRDQNQVVFAWTDVFGLVRRRVEVRRVFDRWFVTDARRCEDPVELVHPLDGDVPIVEELPDEGDGPQYATTTTTTTTTTVPVDGATTSTTSPISEPCGFDPDDTTDDYETLGDYMANGPAEAGCWALLSTEGRACVNEVTTADPSGNPSSEDLYACFDL